LFKFFHYFEALFAVYLLLSRRVVLVFVMHVSFFLFTPPYMFFRKPKLVGLHRVEEHLMAPPSFSAKQLPRYATPKSNAQKRAAAAAPSGGSAAGTAGGGGANKNSSSSDGSAAAAKSARAKVEMEAMRLRVVEQYKELKLKQHAEKEHVKGARR